MWCSRGGTSARECRKFGVRSPGWRQRSRHRVIDSAGRWSRDSSWGRGFARRRRVDDVSLNGVGRGGRRFRRCGRAGPGGGAVRRVARGRPRRRPRAHRRGRVGADAEPGRPGGGAGVLEPGRARVGAAGVDGPVHQAAGVPGDHRDLRGRPAAVGLGGGVRVRVAAGGHARLHRGPDRGGRRPVPRRRPAAVLPGAAEVRGHPRVLVAHPGARGRRGVPQVAGRAGVLRLLRRTPVPDGPVDLRGGAGVAVRAHRPDRRRRAQRRARVRRGPDLLRAARRLDRRPDRLPLQHRDRRVGAGGPQLPQGDLPRADPDRRPTGVPGADAERLRAHGADPAGGDARGRGGGSGATQPVRGGCCRFAAGVRRDHELDV
ncbi:hypothetical protein SUDANB95_03263 [Actinosynnema sp. ALI-1.44]